MPVFNWDGEQMPVIKTGFRCYWAFAVPLTILVLISWGWLCCFRGGDGYRGLGKFLGQEYMTRS